MKMFISCKCLSNSSQKRPYFARYPFIFKSFIFMVDQKRGKRIISVKSSSCSCFKIWSVYILCHIPSLIGNVEPTSSINAWLLRNCSKLKKYLTTTNMFSTFLLQKEQLACRKRLLHVVSGLIWLAVNHVLADALSSNFVAFEAEHFQAKSKLHKYHKLWLTKFTIHTTIINIQCPNSNKILWKTARRTSY